MNETMNGREREHTVCDILDETAAGCKAVQLLRRIQTINWRHKHRQKPTERCMRELEREREEGYTVRV